MKKTLITTLLILQAIVLSGTNPYKISYLTADEGLSRNLVDYIFRDSHGFMWFCTIKGLDRYDGYEFLHFDSRSPVNRLPCDNVHCIAEDVNCNLWIGTENGLFHYNYLTAEISNASKIIKNSPDFCPQQIISIQKDEQGNLLVVHNKGLTKIVFKEGEIKTEAIYQKSSGINCCALMNGNIYGANEKEVFRLIKSTDGSYHKITPNIRLGHLPGNVNILFPDNGILWIGTANGLYKYDTGNETIELYNSTSGGANHLNSDYIADITRNKDGKLLIGTLIGLNIYDYHTDSFFAITTESAFCNLNNNFVNCLWADNSIIWVGTEKGGINILTPEQSLFTNYYHNPSFPGSLSRNPVNAIYEDADGDLWVGTVEGGLNVRKKGHCDFTHYQASPTQATTLSHNSVSCICQDYKNDYWIGTWGLGICKLLYKNKNNPTFIRYSTGKNSINCNLVAAFAPDNINHALWIGTRDGIDYLDVATGKFYHILSYLTGANKIQFVTGMTIDSKRRLWIGTNYGLICVYLNHTSIEKNKIRYRYFRYLLSNPHSGIVEKINCILETRDKQLWLGSNGNGIYKLKESKDKMNFVNYDEQKGLLDNVIYNIQEDETGTLWFSSDKGLCTFNPGRDVTRSFTKTDGLASNQFYWNAGYKGHDGTMFFGSVAGLTSFNPMKAVALNNKNAVSITRIRVLNEDVYPSKISRPQDFLIPNEKNELAELRLHEADKAFSIEFAALNYFQNEKIRYAYRLKGFDNHWTEINSQRRFASFTNIGWGDYILEIKCTNPDGTWSEQIKELRIKVIPPFYKTWWFLLFLITIAGYGIYRYSHYRIKQIRKQETHLRKLVEIRTREIEVQKEQLRHQADQLQANVQSLIEHQEEVSRQNAKLIEQNKKITLQKEELEQLTQKLEEATLDKLSFFTNITHEFRTPITLILGPVERALKLSSNPKVLEQLDIVKRNSRLLLSLINQLMDFRKVESGKMELTKTNQNFIEFLDEIVLPFEDLVKERGISFVRQYHINPSEFLFDKDNMQKVISNLLSNAIKYTPDSGTITVVASTYTDRNDNKERLYMAVKDSGNGIAENELDKIFERFYQSKHNKAYSGYGQSGTGIGLFLCRRIIELHQGRIEALNRHGGGATFRFIIPIERRLSTVVSVDGKQMEMIVAADQDDKDDIFNKMNQDKPTVLVVEDNTDMRHYIRSILVDKYNVVEASNGAVGIEITNRYQPELIISDIMMPVMDGMEFCKKIKTDFSTSHIPVILLTAKSSTETQIESFHIGADAFLTKPFNENLLQAVIHNLSERKKRIQMSFSENMDSSSLNFDDESLDKKFMDRALGVLKDNYTNPDFDVAELIDAMGISRSLLHKKLTMLAGQSASRFIRIYRLNIARELIIMNKKTQSMNISEIAYSVGFNDPKYFTRCFTKHFGTQPSAFLDN